jgi:hypothetical protein
MTALNGPFLGRFAMRRRRSLSALLTFDRDGIESFVGRENTAGMADRWESIFVEVNSALEYRGKDLRTKQVYTFYLEKSCKSLPLSSPLVSTTNN